MAAEGTAAVELGRALRKIRASLPGAAGQATTQAEVARLLYVGGKGAISLFESGKRIPPADVLRRYGRLAQVDPTELLTLRDRALAERDAAGSTAETTSTPDPSGGPPDVSPQPRRRAMLLGLGVGVVGAGFTYTAIPAASPGGTEPRNRIRITTPHTTAARLAPVGGTIHGWPRHNLWIDVQGPGEIRHHPADQPCRRIGSTFSYDSLFIGRPEDVGHKFRISVLATEQGSISDHKLSAYGQRPLTTPNPYRGLAELPPGTTTLASVVVRRL